MKFQKLAAVALQCLWILLQTHTDVKGGQHKHKMRCHIALTPVNSATVTHTDTTSPKSTHSLSSSDTRWYNIMKIDSFTSIKWHILIQHHQNRLIHCHQVTHTDTSSWKSTHSLASNDTYWYNITKIDSFTVIKWHTLIQQHIDSFTGIKWHTYWYSIIKIDSFTAIKWHILIQHHQNRLIHCHQMTHTDTASSKSTHSLASSGSCDSENLRQGIVRPFIHDTTLRCKWHRKMRHEFLT
jgi:hypothetical protein